MSRASPQQYAFNAGELSPLLLGRQDMEKYAAGLSVCHNAVPIVQGAWTRRGGTLYFNSTKFGGTRECRVIPFQFSVTQAYILEFGHQYIRFYTDGGILVNTAQTIENITAANPGVVTITGHGYSDGDRLLISDGGGVTQLDNREVVVANSATNTFEIQDIYGNNIDTSGFDAYSSGGSLAEIFELATTYTESQLDAIRTEQSADVVYILHPDHLPATLTREAALTWTLADVSFVDGPYFPLNATATTLNLSGTTGSVTVTASSATGINGGDGFQSTDVGRLIRWKDPAGNWTWLEITAHSSTTSVTATIQGADASATGATINWRLGVYSDTTGFPRAGIFHEDRLWLGGAALAPQRVDASRTSSYEDFTPTDPDGTVVDDHAIAFTLASGEIQTIFWLQTDEKGLLAGTASGEWVLRPSSLGEALTPSNVTGKQSSTFGSEDIVARKVSSAILFAQRFGQKLRELAYVFESDGFRAPDMTVLSEHITRPKMTHLEYQRNPQPILWIVRSDGVLVGFTYERDQNVLGWHRHTIGGDGTSAGGHAEVEDAAVIPKDDGLSDEVYVVVKRYINGRTERYIEILTRTWQDGDEQEDAMHLDCGTTFTLSPASDTLDGLWYLEGETLGIWADGTVHPDVTVSNGKVTLDGNYSVVSTGYRYNSDGELMPYNSGARDGTAQGKRKRVERIGFWLFDTLSLQYGKDASSLTEILFRKWGDNWGEATPLFTGVVRERFEGDYDRLGQVYFRVSTGAPATVLAAMPQGDTEDDT